MTAARVDVTDLPASMVAVQDGRPGLAGEPAVTPPRHHHEHLDEVGTLGGELILVAGASVVGQPLEHTLFDEMVEPLGEYLTGNPEVGLDVVEAADPGPHVAQDQR